ncbi:MAG: ATPase [Prevotellaceae bacterium]|jgi:N-acetylglucosamine kinase-like BadF-type ATPase|nr:ATPase [Prevotellaceae bacterium]
MILIADSGSTKTEWIMGDCRCRTGGINPFYLSTNEIVSLLEREFTLEVERVSTVIFYGAGALPHKKQAIVEALRTVFGTDDVTVESDLLGAARALCGHSEGIACILGTGSNSCYYDGEKIVSNIPPLGFILGDEGSGAFLGRRLLADLLRGMLPGYIRDDFERQYNASKEDIQESVYRRPLPNRYLAGFTHFIAKHIQCSEISALVDEGFNAFVERNILLYPESKMLPIHFTGSIAYIFRSSLEKVLSRKGLQLGAVHQSPLAGLLEYHSDLFAESRRQ